MTALDEASGDTIMPAADGQAKVIKVYLLDGKNIGENRDWLSVVHFEMLRGLCLFLRDSKGYRAISISIALGLLSKPDQHSLLAILKRSGGGGRVIPSLAVSDRNYIQRDSMEPEADDLRMTVSEREDGEISQESAPEFDNQLVSDDIFSARPGKRAAGALFKDHGSALSTHSSSAGVVASLVRIAYARGWQSIRVFGSEVFRHAVWVEAVAHGMRVRGYISSVPVKAHGTEQPTAISKSNDKNHPETPSLRREKISGSNARLEEKAFAAKVKQDDSSRIVLDLKFQPKIYRTKIDDGTSIADHYTAYEQAVVMARIYDNLSLDFKRNEQMFLTLESAATQLNQLTAERSLEAI